MFEIGCGDQKALGLNTVDEEKQAVDDAAQLVVLSIVAARTRQSVELVEEEDAWLLTRELEDFTNICRRFPKIGRDQTIEFYDEERQPQFAGEDFGA